MRFRRPAPMAGALWVIMFTPAGVSIPNAAAQCDCTCHADPVCDGVTDARDVVASVDEILRGGLSQVDPLCPHVGRNDANCDCVIDILDIVAFIDVAFRGADPAVKLCNPCGTIAEILSFAARPTDNPEFVRRRSLANWCGTDIPLLDGKSIACPFFGVCDNPTTRDTTSTPEDTIDLIVHVIGSDACWGFLPQTVVDATVAQMNQDFANNAAGIQFNLAATRYHDDIGYASINGEGELAEAKALYAESPTTVCNVFITAAGSGFALGIGTFPWMPEAGTDQGGFWLNRIAAGAGSHVATHEMGHCLGLWHTHHGVSELNPCSLCYEYASGFEGDTRGDYAADTPPTPVNFTCLPPADADCEDTPWGPTQPENFMGYARDGCMTLFTPQQIRRMHCWTRDRLPGW